MEIEYEIPSKEIKLLREIRVLQRIRDAEIGPFILAES